MIVETEYILLSVHVTFKLLFYCVKVGGKDFSFPFISQILIIQIKQYYHIAYK